MAFDKIYTLRSLRCWFRVYRKQWWECFSKEDVAQATMLLEKGVRSFEVQPNFLVVNGRYEGNVYFITLDLDDTGNISLQVSKKDKIGRGFAAAGLLLLEKLFEAYIDELTLEETNLPINKAQENVQKKIFGVKQAKVKLVFSKKGQGIFLEIFFQRKNGFEKLTSLNQVIKPIERENLLSLMLQTQKYGFRWNKDGFLSLSLECFENFSTELLPKLSEKYFVECPDCIRNLSHENDSVVVNLLADKTGHLQQKFFLGKIELSNDLVGQSLKNKNRLYWSEKYGIIHWQEKTLSWIRRVNDWRNRFAHNELPAYLALSIFNPDVNKNEVSKLISNLPELEENGIEFQNLRVYQKYGVLWMKHILKNHFFPLLADEMGLGKTRQLLTLLSLLTQEDERPSIIVCPASVIGAWQNECESCFPELNISVLKKDTLSTYESHKTVFIASYSQLLANIQAIKKLNFCCAILDEAQFIKNPKSKTAYACFNLKAQYRVAATGTPLENSLNDVWTIFHFLMPGLLGNFKEFQKFVQNEKNCNILKAQISPFILRRMQKEVLQELPNKNEFVVYCPMSQEQQHLYDQFLQNRINVKTGQWMQLLALILRLRQICCDPGLLPGYSNLPIETSGKITWLLDKLNQLKGNSKVIIFSQFKTLLLRLKPHVDALFPETYLLTGQTLTHQRRTMIRRFQRTKEPAAFLISLKAGGTGITLHTADALFILDPWWNPAVEKQAIARAHRLGQQQELSVYRLLIDNSIESNIQRLQQSKAELFSKMFASHQKLLSKDRWQQLYDVLFDK